MTGGKFALECMAFADSPDKWWRWVRKLARWTIPLSFIVQFVFMFFMLIVGCIGAAVIGVCWTFPCWLRSYYDEQPTWRNLND